MSLYRTTIDWKGLTHGWNPFYGCFNNCYYCYARELHNKRMIALQDGAKLSKQYLLPFNKMQYFPERLKIVKNSKVVKRVFVGDMSDVFYCENLFFREVMEVCINHPYEFMFLTKHPEVYQEKYFHYKNCWCGITATSNKDCHKLETMLTSTGTKNRKIFVSIEPIEGDCSELPLKFFDLVIVGKMSGKNAVIPKKEWIEGIKHHNLHYKNNFHLKLK